MPEITCACGTKFAASSPRARFCSDKCRKRTKRSGADERSASETDGPKVGPIAAAAVRELVEAGRFDTALGQTVLALAVRLDAGQMETGAAYAALSKEFEAKLASATRGAGRASAPQSLQDELAARREARRGA
jgi:hypothetical protein